MGKNLEEKKCTFLEEFWLLLLYLGKGALSTPIQTSLRSLFENPPSFVVMANVATVLWRSCIIVFNENNTSLPQFAINSTAKRTTFPLFLMGFFRDRKSKEFLASEKSSGQTKKWIASTYDRNNFKESKFRRRKKHTSVLTFLGYDNNLVSKTSRCGIDTQNTKKDQNVSLRGRILICNNVHKR